MTRKYVLPDDLQLILPDAPDFISEPPKYSLLEMIEMCEKMLPYWNKKRFDEGLEPKKVMTQPFVLD